MKIFLQLLKRRVNYNMEGLKLCKRLENLSSDLRKSYIKDINKLLEKMLEDYDIVYKNTNKIVNKDIVIHNIIDTYLVVDKEISICKGFSQNGNKCCKRSQADSAYCKVHNYLEFRERVTGNDFKNSLIEFQFGSNKKEIDNTSLQTKFINDSLYYYDNRFIYDQTSLEKVGYIDERNTFVLTDDPFLLEMIY